MAESKVSVACVNADEMRLRVTTEMTVGQWKKVLEDTSAVISYSYAPPIHPLRVAIRKAIEAIEKREDVEIAPQESFGAGGEHQRQFCGYCGHPAHPASGCGYSDGRNCPCLSAHGQPA